MRTHTCHAAYNVQARGFNRQAVPVLVGTKFDLFSTFPPEEQEDITKQVRSA